MKNYFKLEVPDLVVCNESLRYTPESNRLKNLVVKTHKQRNKKSIQFLRIGVEICKSIKTIQSYRNSLYYLIHHSYIQKFGQQQITKIFIDGNDLDVLKIQKWFILFEENFQTLLSQLQLTSFCNHSLENEEILRYLFYQLFQKAAKISKNKIQFQITITRQFNQQIQCQNQQSLRGGGAFCSNRMQRQEQTNVNFTLPNDFFFNSEKYCQKLIDKTTFDEKDSDTLITLQWFIHNEMNFWIAANNRKLASAFYNFSIVKLEQFLMISFKYLRVSGFLFYHLLKICNYFCQVIVKQQSFNEKRVIKEVKLQELKVLITEINQQIQVESNRIWMTGVLYELQLIQTSITHLRTNSTKGRDALLNFIAGVATSLISMKLTDELKKSLQDGAQLLLTIVYEEHIMNPIENYKIFQYFKELKWQILLTLGTDLGVYYTLDLLKESYNKYIKKSKNWIVHFCWIEMISEIFIYQPIISIRQFKIQDWNSFLDNNDIQLLSYDRNEAKLNIMINKQSFFLQNLKILKKIDYLELLELKEKLLENSKNLQDQRMNLWNQYLKFEFEAKNTNNHFEQLQILQGLLRLDNEYFDGIVSLFNQSKESLVTLENKQVKISNQLNQNQNDQNYQMKELAIIELNKIYSQIQKFLKIILLTINECQCYFLFIKTKLTHFFDIIKEIKDDIKSINQEFTLFIEQFQEFTKILLPKIFQTWLEMQDILIQSEVNQSLLDIQNNLKQEKIIQKLKDLEEYYNNFLKLNKILNNIQQKGLQYIFKLKQDTYNPYQISMKRFYKEINEIHSLDFLKLIFCKNELDQVNFVCINFLFVNKQRSIPKEFQQFVTSNDQKDAIFLCLKILKVISFFKLLLSVIYHKSKQIKFSYNLQNHQLIDDIIIDADQVKFINSISQEIKNNLVELHVIKTSYKKLQEEKNLRNQFEKIINQMQEHQKFFEKFIINKEFEKQIKEIKQLIKQQILEIQITILLLIDGQFLNQIEIIEQQQELLLSQIKKLVQQLTQKNEVINKQEAEFQNQLLIEDPLSLKDIRQKLDDTDKNWNIIYQLLIKSFKDEERNVNQIAKIFERIENAYLNFTDFINEIGNLEMSFPSQQLNELAQLQLCEFQNFYLNLPQYFNHQKAKQQKRECEYLEFMLALQNQQSNQKQQSTNIIFKLFQSNSFRVRECLLFQLIQMQNQCQDNQIIRFSQELIKQFWIAENDQNVRSLLKNQELIDFQKKLFSYDLQSFSEQIKEEMQKQLKQIELLEEQARIERNSSQEDEFEEKLKKLYQEFEDKFDNVTEMSDKVGLNLLFLKDMAKDIKLIKNKIDKLQETVNIIGNDIKKLRGKTFMELLKIRKEQVLINKIKRDLDSVYIELQTQEIDPKSGQVIATYKGSKTSCLFKEERFDFEGEINEFLWDEKEKQKDVMLIKGQAGSGKTRASKMIEEYLWTQQNQYNDPWIPIFVSLPQLKDPRYNLFYEVLESENYNFDFFQIKEFIEAIQKKKVRLLLILDSYDEMKLENIESNLFKTNKFQQEFTIEAPGEQFKMIITVRSETLNQSNYQLLFYGNSLDQLKEVNLLPFQHELALEYLKQFSLLNIKRKISNFYEFQKQIRGGKFQIKEFLDIWATITPVLDYGNDKINFEESLQKEKNQKIQLSKNEKNESSQLSNSDFKFEDIVKNTQFHYIMNFFGDSSQDVNNDPQKNEILTKSQINQLVKVLKKQKIFEGAQESQYIALQKDLASLWSKQKFQQTIKKAQILHFLQTPFMMEIIVQVLPNMVAKAFEYTKFKDGFIENFQNNKYDSLRSNFLKQYYQQNIGQNEDKIQNLNLKQEEIKQEVKKSLESVLFNLEKIKFFQNFNISENIIKINQKLKFQNQEILIGEDIDIVIKCLQTAKITGYEFYENFVQFYSESQLQKWRDLGQINNSDSYMIDFTEYQQSLAIDLTLRELTQINYTKKGRFQQLFAQKNNLSFDEDYWKHKYFAYNSDDDSYYKILKSCILLSSNGSTYQFTHKSIQEYFVGKQIIDTIIKFQSQNERKQTQQQWISNEIYNSNSFNISQGQYQGCLKLIFDQLEQIKGLEESLLQMIILSRNVEFIRAASNSIYLLSYLQSFIENYDLSEIQINDSIISGLSLPKCNLSKTQFNDVRIDSCNLNYANLADANWYNCIYNETKILKNHKHSVQCITYSKDGKIMISGDSEGNIIIWDLLKTKVFCEFNQNKIQIKQLVILDQENFLVAVDDDYVFFWNIENLQQPKQIGELDYFEQIQISSDQQTFISLQNYFYFEWDLKKLIKNLQRSKFLNTSLSNTHINRIIQTSDENYLFLLTSEGMIIVYEIRDLFQEINQLVVHQKDIYIFKISEIKELLVTASKDFVIKLWNYENINCIENVKKIELPSYNYSNLYFSFNGIDLLGLLSDSYIYSVNDFKKQYQSKSFQNFPLSNKDSYQCWQQNQILSFEKEFILIYDFSNLSEIIQTGKIEYKSNFFKFWFIKTQFLALVYNDRLEIWNFSILKLCNTIYFNQSLPKTGSFSNDESQIALLLDNNQLEIYTIKDESVERQSQIIVDINKEYSSCLEFSYSNRFLALTNDKFQIIIYTTDSFQEYIVQAYDSCLQVRQLFFTKKDDLIIDFQNVIKILIFKEKNIEFKTIYSYENCKLHKLFMNYDQNLLIAAFEIFSSIRLIKFNCDDLNKLITKAQFNQFQKKQKNLKNFYFLQIQNCLIVRYSDDFDLFHLNQDEEIKEIFIEHHQYKVQDLCFSNNRKYLASISDKELFIYDKNLEIYKIGQLGGQVIRFSQDDTKIFIYKSDNIILLNFNQNLDVFFEMEFQFQMQLNQISDCLFNYQQGMLEFMWNNYMIKKQLLESDNLDKLNYEENKVYILQKHSKIKFQIINMPKKIALFSCFCRNFTYYGNGELIISKIQEILNFYNKQHSLIFQFGEKKLKIVSYYFIHKIKQLIIGHIEKITIYDCDQIFNSKKITDKLKQYHVFTYLDSLKDFCVNEDKQIIISIHFSFICVWSILEKKKIFSFNSYSNQIQCIISLQDGNTFITGDSDCKIKIWKLQHYQQVINTQLHFDQIKKIQYSKDSEYLISTSQDQSMIVFDIFKKKAVQKFDFINSRLLNHSDCIIKSNFDYLSLQYLEIIQNPRLICNLDIFKHTYFIINQNSSDSEDINHEDDLKRSQQYQSQHDSLIHNLIISQDGKVCLYKQNQNIQSYLIFCDGDKYFDLKEKKLIQDFSEIFKEFCEDFDVNQKKEKKKINILKISFNQTNSLMYVAIAHIQDKYFIVIFDLENEDYTVFPKDQFNNIINVLLNDNLLLIQENMSELKLLKSTSKLFKSFVILGVFKHDQNIITEALDSSFIYFIDKNGKLIILNKNKFKVTKIINQEFSFDQDIAISASILYKQFYAVGLINGKLLIWNVEQDYQNNQFFFQLQLPKQQPIIQIQFSKTNYVVGCLCGSFIWFINFKSSQNQIIRSAYLCYYDFIFYQDQTIMHFDSNSRLALSNLYNCINYDCFQQDEEIGFRKFSQDGRYLAYSNNRGKLKIYDFTSECIIKFFSLQDEIQVLDIIFSTRNKWLVIICSKKEQYIPIKKFINIWTLENSINLFQIQIPAQINKNVSACEISNDEDYIMIATSDLKLVYLTIQKMEIMFIIDGFESFVTAIAFSPNQNQFVLGLQDGSLLLYNFNKQQQVVESNYEQKGFIYKPVCIKIFSRLPQLLSYSCKLSTQTKIENNDGQSLVYIFLQKQGEIIKNNE